MYIYLLLYVFWILLLVPNKSSVKMVTGTKAFHLTGCSLKIMKSYQFGCDLVMLFTPYLFNQFQSFINFKTGCKLDVMRISHFVLYENILSLREAKSTLPPSVQTLLH